MANEMRFLCKGCDHYLVCKHAYKEREECSMYKPYIVDAKPVVHGRWECVYDESMGETDVTCSHCKDTRTIKGCYVTVRDEPCYFEDNYCPDCGADMRERGEGE